MIYFIQNTETQNIKIGFSLNLIKLEHRFSDLQVSNEHTLKILGYVMGSREFEKKLHKKFSHIRIRGEWFKGKEVLEYLKENPPREFKNICQRRMESEMRQCERIEKKWKEKREKEIQQEKENKKKERENEYRLLKKEYEDFYPVEICYISPISNMELDTALSSSIGEKYGL